MARGSGHHNKSARGSQKRGRGWGLITLGGGPGIGTSLWVAARESVHHKKSQFTPGMPGGGGVPTQN